MARNRQRAKERQARRKAAGNGEPAPRVEPEPGVEPEAAPDKTQPTPEEVQLQTGAPPEDVGRSDEVLEYEQDLDEEEIEDEDHFDPEEDQPEDDPALVSGPRGNRGEDPAQHKNRPRFVQFLLACWAELQRVQWPDRQTLTTLTGVVLGFVLIAGGYLGLLDAIFSRLIQAIL